MPRDKIIPQNELEKLGDLLSYLVVQRELSKPVLALKRILRDLRLVILNIVTNYYQSSSFGKGELFVQEVRDYLFKFRDEIDGEECDEEFLHYCIDQTLSTFKQAPKIKAANPSIRGKLLTMLILRSFDFKLKPLIRLVKDDEETTNLSH